MALVIIVTVAATLAIAGLGLVFYNLLSNQFDLRQRVAQLEQAQNATTHTRNTIAGIEDATAVLIDIEFEFEALKARAETARRILGATRTSPHAYDPDRPAGRRKNGR